MLNRPWYFEDWAAIVIESSWNDDQLSIIVKCFERLPPSTQVDELDNLFIRIGKEKNKHNKNWFWIPVPVQRNQSSYFVLSSSSRRLWSKNNCKFFCVNELYFFSYCFIFYIRQRYYSLKWCLFFPIWKFNIFF